MTTTNRNAYKCPSCKHSAASHPNEKVNRYNRQCSARTGYLDSLRCGCGITWNEIVKYVEGAPPGTAPAGEPASAPNKGASESDLVAASAEITKIVSSDFFFRDVRLVQSDGMIYGFSRDDEGHIRVTPPFVLGQDDPDKIRETHYLVLGGRVVLEALRDMLDLELAALSRIEASGG